MQSSGYKVRLLNHTSLVEIGRDLWKLYSPTLLLKAGSPTEDGFLNISRDGSSTVIEMRKSPAN